MRHSAFRNTSVKTTEGEWYKSKFQTGTSLFLANLPEDIKNNLGLETEDDVFDNLKDVLMVGSMRILHDMCHSNADNPITLKLTYSGKNYIKLIYSGFEEDSILNECKKDLVKDLEGLKSFPDTIELTCMFDVKNLNTVVGYTVCDKVDANKTLTHIMHNTIHKSAAMLTDMAYADENSEKRETISRLISNEISKELSSTENVLLTTCAKFLQRYVDAADKITVVDTNSKCNFTYSVEAVERLLTDRLKLNKAPLEPDYDSTMEHVLSNIEYSK